MAMKSVSLNLDLNFQPEDASVAVKPSSAKENIKVEISSKDLFGIEIRKFSGKLTDWPEFRKEYRALVHLNSNITNCQKFTILKYLLPTEIFELVKNIPNFRDANIGYNEAWTVLEEKFSKRKNVEELLTTLMQLPSINGSFESIIQFLETIKSCLNGLMYWDVNTKNWDMVLIHILVQKLNNETKTEWKILDSCRNKPNTIFDFINFLSSKIRSQRKSNKMSYDPKDVDRLDCVYCQQKHPLWKCEKFELLNIDDRLSFVRNKIICVRCLSNKHTTLKCWKPFKCRICHNKDHHFLLHKNTRQRSYENLLD